MTHYWIAVACYSHVKRGLQEGICQVCHGKAGPLKLMSEGDWLIYYSPTLEFGKALPCRRFTAVGRVKAKAPYQFQMSADFVPWRRDIAYLPARAVPIEPLINQLNFIADKAKWGFPFRRGCFRICAADFQLIAVGMGIEIDAGFFAS